MLKLASGELLRISKFTNVSEDGTLQTSWNANKGRRGKDKRVFAAVLLGVQPFVMDSERSELEFLNAKTALELIGYVSVDKVEEYAKKNIGEVGKIFNRLVNAEVKKRLKKSRRRS